YDDAYNYFRSSAYMDISDFKKNTDSGLHIACLGGVWMSVVHGFFGMRLYSDTGLQFETHLPQNWTKCSFRINYKGSLIEIYATKEKTEFTLISGNKSEFMANGQLISLDNEKSVEVQNEVKQG
ncbi:MAG: glycoside hydrolase family 65 protein, partial [Clostridia bacterium]|nr:glycoside hydrolase family 65 protein [Clostridia bacterium]